MERLNWRLAEVVEAITQTPRAKSLILNVPDWHGHRPGQHVDVRLTAEDGYQAQRSYSIGNAFEGERIEIAVEEIEDGEVSPYLVEELRAGDQLELRGPIGGYFTWTIDQGGPVALIAGGSGIVPLMAMIRHRINEGSNVPMRLLYSARSAIDLFYREELKALVTHDPQLEIVYTLTRNQPPDWTGYRRRVDAEMLAEIVWPAGEQPLIYVCGPTNLVESVATTLVEQGHDSSRVRTERFGPSGG
ncbi:ferredoxin reductase [soil metagenome]